MIAGVIVFRVVCSLEICFNRVKSQSELPSTTSQLYRWVNDFRSGLCCHDVKKPRRPYLSLITCSSTSWWWSVVFVLGLHLTLYCCHCVQGFVWVIDLHACRLWVFRWVASVGMAIKLVRTFVMNVDSFCLLFCVSSWCSLKWQLSGDHRCLFLLLVFVVVLFLLMFVC